MPAKKNTNPGIIGKIAPSKASENNKITIKMRRAFLKRMRMGLLSFV